MTRKQRIIQKLKAHAEKTNRSFSTGNCGKFSHAFIGHGPRFSQSHCLSVIIGPRGGTKLRLDGKKTNTSLNIILDVYIR